MVLFPPLCLAVLSKMFSLEESHGTSPMGSHFYEVPRAIRPTGTGSRWWVPGTGEEAVGVRVKENGFLK